MEDQQDLQTLDVLMTLCNRDIGDNTSPAMPTTEAAPALDLAHLHAQLRFPSQTVNGHPGLYATAYGLLADLIRVVGGDSR
jgi:hypothetical protein